jgi:hypothetical protein
LKSPGKVLLCLAATLVSATRSDAAWLKPGDTGRLTQRQLCPVNLPWLDVGRGADPGQLAHLEQALVNRAQFLNIEGAEVHPPRRAVVVEGRK